jgi:hypothetical protein
MEYISMDDYVSIYPDDDISGAFGRLAWDASRLVDNLTTGVDGIKKLKYAFPTEAEDKEAVKMCCAKLVHLMYQIETMQEEQMQAARILKQPDGTYQSALIASRSAGNESISYANGSNLRQSSIIAAAVADPLTRQKLYRDTVMDCLRGAHDANGVGLLYGGRYPYVL